MNTFTICVLVTALAVANASSDSWFYHSLQDMASSRHGHATPLAAQQSGSNVVRFTPVVGQQQMAPQQQFVSTQQQATFSMPVQQQQQPVLTMPTMPVQPKIVSACDPNPCQNEGVCSIAGDSFQCNCPWGFTGLRCETCNNDCASNPCPANKRCRAGFGGGFDCVCPANATGLNCEIPNTACAVNPCKNQGLCKLAEGGTFQCECTRPWDGRLCEKMFENPCTADVLRQTDIVQFNNPWDHNGYLICVDLNVYHAMSCAPGTFFSERLNHCVPIGYNPPDCPVGFCQNNGLCVTDANAQHSCVCHPGFSGDRCQTNIDECTLFGNQACAGGTCVDQVNGFYCQCQNGQIGVDCTTTIANPCTLENLSRDLQYFELPSSESNTYLHCTGQLTFVVNRCAENLFWHTDEQTCSAEKAVPKLKGGCTLSCRNGGQCQQDPVSGGSFCLCRLGYTGAQCEFEIDNCASSPCLNNGLCISHPGGYNCICQDKIIDECCCNGIVNPCPSSSTNAVADTFFPHLFPNRYIQCDHMGRAFVKNCAPTTKWRQDVLSCLPTRFVLPPIRNQTVLPQPATFDMNSLNVPVAKSATPVFQQQFRHTAVPAISQQQAQFVPQQQQQQFIPQQQQQQMGRQQQLFVAQPVMTQNTFTMPVQQQQQPPQFNFMQQQPQAVKLASKIKVSPEFLLKLVSTGANIPQNMFTFRK